MLARIILVFVTLPWVITEGAVHLVVGLVRLPWRLRLMHAQTLMCPDGHVNPTHGRWTCRCGANYLGHAFGPCPVCGMPAGWLHCETCGLAIRSPWKKD